MKHIFLVKDNKKLTEVYSERFKARLETMGLDTDKYYTKKELEQAPDAFKDVEYIFSTWYMPELTKDEIQKYFPSLKAVFYAAGTVKSFAGPYLELGIDVFSAGAANAVPVAEFAYAQILLACKGYYMAQKLCKRGLFKKARRYAGAHTGNYGAVIGMLGAGKIGSMVIEHLKRHNVDILVFDKYLSAERIAAMGAQKAELKEIFEKSDVISNHLADTPETQKMLGYELFASMKPYATFINTGRGRQVDERGLAKALRKRGDLCAVLDVTSHEPMWPHNPLWLCSNLFISPHIAGSQSKEQLRMAEYILEEYERYIAGEPCTMKITAEMLKSMT